MNTSISPEKGREATFPWSRLVVLLAAAVLLTFLIATPDGLLAKADMVGYAVCHRIGSHSFSIGGRQLPLCARCSGTFLGALTAFVGQAVVLRRHRAGEFPPVIVLVILASFTLLWAADGLNSYMALIGGPHLYEPHNWLRLATGALNGLTMGALAYPVVNFTLWRRPIAEPAIGNLGDLGTLLLLEASLVGLVLTQWSLLLYPLAVLSALGVLVLLTTINSTLLLTILRWENRVDTWREAAIPLLTGLTMALIQVGVIDAVRYALTGTLSGIPPLQ